VSGESRSESGESRSVSGSERRSAISRRNGEARQKRSDRRALSPAIRTFRCQTRSERILRGNGRKNNRSLTSCRARQTTMLLDPERRRL
jgi:hypothetical protein